MLSRTATEAAVSGQSGTGGSEVQNFCYDEQNRLIWSSNNAAVPPAGNGTCGNVGYQSTLGGNYTNQYAYTNLGQLWKGPLNGGTTQEQYLYCDSAHPHQLSNLSQTASTPTCASKGTVDYTGSYDSWGNTTSQLRGGITRTLKYDGLDHLVRWSSSVNSQEEWNLYDASGERVLRQTYDGTNTVITVFAFGVEEHAYSYSGSGSSDTNTSNTYYYTLGGHTLGTWDGTSPGSPTTNFLLTDTLGSVVSSFNNLPNGAAVVLGDQVYGPYGNRRVQQGTISTSKGFTGQFTDFVAGLDYYGARYYDPVVGVFVSADVVEGNGAGMNPYGYVAGNPETYNDPTGLSIWGDLGGLVQSAEQVATQVEQSVQQFVDTEPLPAITITTVVAAPVVLPALAIVGIGVGLGLLAGAIYTALTPQNLASGTLPPAGPIGFDPPRQNNVDSSPPQTQAGGGGQGNQPPGGGHVAPSPSPGDDSNFRRKIDELKKWREQENLTRGKGRPQSRGVSAQATADGLDPIRKLSGAWDGGEPIEGLRATRYFANTETGAGSCAEWQICAEIIRNKSWWGQNIQIDLEGGGRSPCISCDPVLRATAERTGSTINVTWIDDLDNIVNRQYP